VSGVPWHYQNLSDAVEKGGSTKGAVLLGSFELNGSRRNPAENSQLPNV
jgi:hypothetical protein